jgi:hypothetical protein
VPHKTISVSFEFVAFYICKQGAKSSKSYRLVIICNILITLNAFWTKQGVDVMEKMAIVLKAME